MAKRVFAGRGASAIKGTKKLRKDVAGLSDAAKREKRLEAKVADKQKQIRRKGTLVTSRKHAEKYLRRVESSNQKIKRIQVQAADLRTRAKKVEASKTGNKKAAAAYRQAADELLARIPALRKKK